ncbi:MULTISPECIES: DUF222 domain-containing protein [unclassified Pseudofrankia]|uniref:DUF222 domain-containing protein n=1 Tax=unclassified Pseudofrankia TaxID=2994372 RepID=UPI0008DA0E80|nr:MULTISPECIES: DUF222 domain-containing protein [unclassified Pseudofrankia]MDT3440559.1 DUF222 domain-containing protein [Pseudofrankia sp. BMG5.37]OHV47789.1 hypothetical protein BCD48_17620 [Pseudofrankia sp. BMG5.36]
MDGDGVAVLEALRHALAEIEPASLPDGAVVDLLSQLGGVIAAAQAALVRAVGAAELAGVWGRSGLRGTAGASGPAGAADTCAVRCSAGPDGDGGQAGPGGEDGRPTPAGWIAGRARLTVAAAAALLVAARALAGLPVLAEAFRRGEVSLDHVLALTAPLTSPPRLVAVAGPVETELTALARRAGPDQVRAAVTHWLRDADPAGVERDAAAAGRVRSLSLVPVPPGCAEAHPGGCVTIAGSVPVDDATTLLDALRLAARATAGPADARVPAQRRADALLTVARCYLAAAGHLTTAARSELPQPCSGTGSEAPSVGRCSSRGSASRSC